MFEASVLFIFGKLVEKLRMLNSFIQQGFRPWCKVNWMENFLKCRPVASLESCQRSAMEIFYEIDDFF